MLSIKNLRWRTRSECAGRAQKRTRNLVTYEYVKVNLYMWMKDRGETCGTEFLSPAQNVFAVTNLKRKNKDLILEVFYYSVFRWR